MECDAKVMYIVVITYNSYDFVISGFSAYHIADPDDVSLPLSANFFMRNTPRVESG